LDEPTSGLDSQTSWNILQLLRKLTAAGQAILCTIHQPSAILFENFDRLLFLAKGGKTVYFGPVGANSHILIDYFVRNGAPPCPKGENPAEWMLSVIGAAPGSHTEIDWHATWNGSPEKVGVRAHLDEIKATRPHEASAERSARPEPTPKELKIQKSQYKEFAAPFLVQTRVVVRRVFQQYWRTPSYIYSKFFLSIAISLFLGFSFFRADRTQAGLQSQLFSAFMVSR
jgi:ATP-binding cassette subfamily G (WHITE) protein 2 (PDR)